MGGSKKKLKKAIRRNRILPIAVSSHPNCGLYLISESGNIIGTVEPKPKKVGKIRASRQAERPNQYGTFAFSSYSWGFKMARRAPAMKAGRVIRQPTPAGASGMISEALREKAISSIGSQLLPPSLLQTRTAILKM